MREEPIPMAAEEQTDAETIQNLHSLLRATQWREEALRKEVRAVIQIADEFGNDFATTGPNAGHHFSLIASRLDRALAAQRTEKSN